MTRSPWLAPLAAWTLTASLAAAGTRDSAPPPPGDSDAALEEQVARLARVGGCRSPSFSPDGRELAFVSDLSGVPQAWIVDVESSWPQQVTGHEDPVGDVSWSPDGTWLAFSRAPGGGMNEQLYVVRPDGTQARRLTPGGRVNNWLGPWRPDGKALSYSSNRRDPSSMDSFLQPLDAAEPRLVALNAGIGRMLDLSADGRRGLLQRVASRGDEDLFLVDLEDGSAVHLTPHEPPARFAPARLGPDAKTVYLASNDGRDLAAFARIRVGAEATPEAIEVLVARPDAELDELALSEDGAFAALVWNAGGRSELEFVELATLRRTPGPALPAEIGRDPVFSSDGRTLALVVSGAAAPSDIWLFDRPTGHRRQVTFSPRPGVRLDGLVRPALARYTAHDGLELSGWLYQPPGVEGAAPYVLSFHGGPESQERPRFNATYQALVARGIGVFAPNVRGSSGFGKRFVNLDNGRLRFDAIEDIGASADYLVNRGLADPKRLGIMGGSYGGYMTLAGLAWFPERFAAGANLFGIVSFESFFEHTEPWMAAISTVEYGDPATEAALLAELSPLARLVRLAAPTLVLHGANDTNVPVVEAEQVVEQLQARGVPVEYVLFPDEGHGFRKTSNRIRASVAIVRWFERHLRPAGIPTPER